MWNEHFNPENTCYWIDGSLDYYQLLYSIIILFYYHYSVTSKYICHDLNLSNQIPSFLKKKKYIKTIYFLEMLVMPGWCCVGGCYFNFKLSLYIYTGMVIMILIITSFAVR